MKVIMKQIKQEKINRYSNEEGRWINLLKIIVDSSINDKDFIKRAKKIIK